MSARELMAIVIARSLRDGDTLVMGTNAAIPRAAALAAQQAGKRITTLIGAFGTVDPSIAPAPASGADETFLAGRFATGLGPVIADQLRGRADVIFLGGLQVDQRGRVNLAVVGDHARPRLRGPGTVGVSLIASIPRTIMFFERHDPRVFVDSVDFVGAEGLRQDGGIELIVTPLAVLGPVADRGRIDLVSIHPGVAFEVVQDSTSFPLNPAAAVTPAPSAAELQALRCSADGLGLAASESRS